MKLLRSVLSILAVAILAVTFLFNQPVLAASFNANFVMLDSAFNDSGSMNAGQIDAWLNSNYGSTSCISTDHGFKAPEPIAFNPGSGFSSSGSFNYTSNGFWYGPDVTAGTVIYDAAHVYGLSPKVILTTLEKEESLVSGSNGCSVNRYVSALGYDCPDTETHHNYSGHELYSINGVKTTGVTDTCVARQQEAGFSQQVIYATWQFRFNEQRSEGNTGWDVKVSNFPHSSDKWDDSGDPSFCYSGYMTPGNRALGGAGSGCTTVTSWDGKYTIDGSTAVTMETGATASLYDYTPHISGNQSFFNLFVQWFGNPDTPCYGTANVSGAATGRQFLDYQASSTSPKANLTLSEMNNTGSDCAEAHLWNYGYTSWNDHITTGMVATNPASGMLVNANIAGDKRDELFYIKYGNVQIHQFSQDLQKFLGVYDVATNLSGVSPAAGTFVAGDFLGRGYDQLLYIRYNTGGDLQIHMFSKDLRRATGTYDVSTNLTGITASSGVFVAGDFLRKGYDQLAFIKYGSASRPVQIHIFSKDLRRATGTYDVATSLKISATTGTFVAGDFNGKAEQLVYLKYNDGQGRVEAHTFSADLRRATGTYDVVTNLAGFSPPL